MDRWRRARSRPRWPRTAKGCGALTFVVLSLLYLVSPVVGYGDGRNAGPTAASVVTDGDLAIDEFADVSWFDGYQTVHVEGEAFDWYPWTRSVFAVPIAAGVELAGVAGVGDGSAAAVRSDTWEPLLLLVPGALTTAGAAGLLTAVAWRWSTAAERRSRVALAVGLGSGLATGYWSTSSRGMWQHGPACFWFTLALLAGWHVAHGNRARLAAAVVGGAATAAAFTRPTFLFLALSLGVWVAISHRRHLAAAGAGAFVTAVPILAVNLASFGSLMMPYFDADSSRRSAHAADSVWFGFAATVASPSRGMLVFMPLAVVASGMGLAMRARRGSDKVLERSLAVGAAGVLAFSVTSPDGWWAGHSFGPRSAVDIIPVMAFLALPAVDRLLCGHLGRPAVAILVATAVWSVFVQAQGATIRQSSCWNVQPTDIDDDRARVWDWGDSQALAGARWVLDGGSPLATDCEATGG